MKIGILTYHAVYNFGANLQALSTVNYLKNAGHEPVIIDFFPKLLEEAFDKSVLKEQANMHKAFLSKHFILTKRCQNAKDIAIEISTNNIEAVIIGSDAVVQHQPLLARIRVSPSRKKIVKIRIEPVHYETNFPNPFWGEFILHLNRKIKVAMMSVSCQNTDYILITGKEREAINGMIRNISFISVRDKRTQKLFKYVSKGTIVPEITPDPVFAFNQNILNQSTKNDVLQKFGLPNKYILFSFNSTKTVNESWILSFEAIAKKNGYQCVGLTMPGGLKFGNHLKIKIEIPLDPLDWYNIIKYSSAYIGEKMHPIIVALHNSVPFFSFDHYGIVRFKFFFAHDTSKIFQILERAKFVENRVSTKRHYFYRPPSPEFVFNKIYYFDQNRCSKFAKQILKEYNEMMLNLLTEIGDGIELNQ